MFVRCIFYKNTKINNTNIKTETLSGTFGMVPELYDNLFYTVYWLSLLLHWLFFLQVVVIMPMTSGDVDPPDNKQDSYQPQWSSRVHHEITRKLSVIELSTL